MLHLINDEKKAPEDGGSTEKNGNNLVCGGQVGESHRDAEDRWPRTEQAFWAGNGLDVTCWSSGVPHEHHTGKSLHQAVQLCAVSRSER